MVVRQVDAASRRPFGQPPGFGRGVGIDIERRDIGQPVGRRHRRQIDPEPEIRSGRLSGKNQLGFASGGSRSRPATRTVPARWPAARFARSFRSAGIKPRSTKMTRPSAAAAASAPRTRTPPAGRGGDRRDLPVVQEHALGHHPVEFRSPPPRQALRRRDRRRGQRRLALGDQPALPLQPLQLPGAERQADQGRRPA